MTGYNDISVYYRTNFILVQNHKYSLTEIYDMYPYERDIFVEMLAKQIEESQKEQ